MLGFIVDAIAVYERTWGAYPTPVQLREFVKHGM